ncbi:hypothetical protein NFI96_020916 [Prochilodus magdalenae]|nr:hypothetical protein NFI96_020916 [Prochilodus magdalenae]
MTLRTQPGSTVADFTIVATSNTLNFSAANKQLASALIAKGYNVTENSVAQTEENGLCDPDNSIYPGENMVLTCTPPDSRIVKINWNVNGNNIETSIKYQISSDGKTLTVTNTSDEDSGQYACIMTFDSIPYIIWQRVVIQPFPNVQASSSKTLNCEGLPVTLECCAHNGYTTQWSLDTSTGPLNLTEPSRGCSPYTYTNISVEACKDSDQIVTFLCEAQDIKGSLHNRTHVRVHATAKRYDCYDEQFGAGNVNGIQTRVCDTHSIGSVTARCQFNTPDKGVWEIVDNNCVLRVLQELVERAENLQIADVAQFTLDLWKVTDFNSARIRESDVNVLTVVTLLKRIANISQTFIVDQSIMMDFLRTSDVISSVTTRKTWERLNTGNTTRNTSSELLKSIEDIGTRLTDDSFNITTLFTHLNRTRANGSFFGVFGIDSTTQIEIPEFGEAFITTIVFSALDNVLPVRNTTYNESTTKANINGDVAAVIVNNTVHNISLTFDIKNKSFESPQCVFWNFSLLDGIGGWDSTGCEVKPLNQTDKITCVCNHTTSFSLLMSPFPTDYGVLRIITFIGVGISIFCLISALIIESIVWKSVTKNDTSYMRHVSIVNIALSLLIADICFIIGAAIVKRKKAPVGPCNAATFFMHFFYLALFFWMLVSALLLLYRTIMVFSRASKSVMKVIAFAVGYGAPLLIAVITVAITIVGGGYIQEENACWLNWFKTKALLAFVIPALTIVAINLLVLIVVLYKMLRRGVGAANQPDGRYALVVIVRCVAILTPIFGLTWGFGIGTMVSSALGIHIVFAVLNSLQVIIMYVCNVCD